MTEKDIDNIFKVLNHHVDCIEKHYREIDDIIKESEAVLTKKGSWEGVKQLLDKIKSMSEVYIILKEIAEMLDHPSNPQLKDDEYLTIPLNLSGSLQRRLRNILNKPAKTSLEELCKL